MLANWYWDYFQQNRWRFMQRTQTAEPPGDGHTDLGSAADPGGDRQAFHGRSEIRASCCSTHRYRNSSDCSPRDRCPTATVPRCSTSSPTMRCGFMRAGEQAGGGSRRLRAAGRQSDIRSLGGISGLEVSSRLTCDLHRLKAIRLYQRLLAFHRQDEDTAALADADLGRLAVWLQPGVWGREERTLQGCFERFCETMGRCTHLRSSICRLGRSLAQRTGVGGCP